jgi:hypothetical protein
MARPRVFVSSTYYDLKYVRSSLELFINSLGFDSVLFEHGDVAFAPDKALDESCYREVQGSDIYVLIIGGRYGSEVSETKTERQRSFFEQYESISKMEYKAALDKDMPIYILIEKAVYAEYQTFRKNVRNESIVYAHVDHSGVFKLIEDVLSRKRNNPMQTFDRYSEIEEWLRIQWAGLYRELLSRMHGQKQIASLAEKVNELGQISKTLRRYLEGLLEKLTPDQSHGIIKEETERLAEAEQLARIKAIPIVDSLDPSESELKGFLSALRTSKSLQEFITKIDDPSMKKVGRLGELAGWLREPDAAKRSLSDLNQVRTHLGLPPLTIERGASNEKSEPSTKAKARSSRKPKSGKSK